MHRSDERYKRLTDAERIAGLSAENTALADENVTLRERLAELEPDAASYGILRDAIDKHLDPQDGEEAECYLLVQAVEHAAERLAAADAELQHRLERNVELLHMRDDAQQRHDDLLYTSGEEIKALNKQLAAAEQCEQQARAIIDQLYSADIADAEGDSLTLAYTTEELFAEDESLSRGKAVRLRASARAWLADRAEQRAATEQEAK